MCIYGGVVKYLFDIFFSIDFQFMDNGVVLGYFIEVEEVVSVGENILLW